MDPNTSCGTVNAALRPDRGERRIKCGKIASESIFPEMVVDRDVKIIQFEMAMTKMRNFTGSNITTRWC